MSPVSTRAAPILTETAPESTILRARYVMPRRIDAQMGEKIALYIEAYSDLLARITPGKAGMFLRTAK